MKKKLTASLVSGLIGLFALSSCSSSVTVNDKSIMEIKDYNGNVIKIITDNIYNKYAKTSTGLAKYYDAVLETMIRYHYQNPDFHGKTDLPKSFEEVKNIAQNQVEADKVTAKNNASTNKTTYSEEWEKILDEKKVDDEEGLLQYYIYKEEKDCMETWYYTANEETLLEEYLGYNEKYEYVSAYDGKVNNMFPYHIRHILNKTAGSSTNFTRDVITESEAKNLSKTVKSLTTAKDGKSPNFGLVAKECSEDSSNTSYGDVGIVTPETSFVNEFKLGVYAYDALLSGKNTFNYVGETKTEPIYKGFGLTEELKNSTFEGTVTDAIQTLNGGGQSKGEPTHDMLDLIPAQLFYKLGDLASKTKDDNNKDVNGGDENFYPRNILWNNYLNIHNVFLITDQNFDGEKSTEISDSCFELITNHVDGSKLATTEKSYKILVDDHHRPIIGVRSQYGIHFIVMEKSIFKNTNDIIKGSDETDKKYAADLIEYYTTDVNEAKESEKVTYITSINRTDTLANYQTRAKAIKDAVKGFDKTYDYRLYEHLMNDCGIKVEFKDPTLKNNIELYINEKRESNKESSQKTLNTSWRTYLEQLNLQETARKDNYVVAGNANITKADTLPQSGDNGDFIIVANKIYLRNNSKWECIRDLDGKSCTIIQKLGDAATETIDKDTYIVCKDTMVLYQAKNSITSSPITLDSLTPIKAMNGYKGKLISDVCRQTFGTGSAEWQMGGKCYNGK